MGRASRRIPALILMMLCVVLARTVRPQDGPAPPPEREARAAEETEAAEPAERSQEEAQPEAAKPGGIVLNFKDASLDAVLDYLSEAAGFAVVKDVEVEGRVSVVSRQSLSPKEAVDLLNTVLKDKGYAAVRMGRTLKIIPLSEAKKASIPVRSGADPEAIKPSDRLVTQVIPLRFVDATKLKADVAPLVPAYAELAANASSNSLILTDTEANIRRIVEIVRALDTHLSAVAEVRVFPLQYASAVSAAKLINEIFKQEEPTQRQQSPFDAFRRFRRPGTDSAGAASGGEEARRGQKVIASADERTNTVVVTGPPDVLEVIAGVVKELDSNPTAEQAVFVYKLKNAKSANLAKILNDLFTDRSSTQGTTSRAAATPGAGGTEGRREATNGRAGFFSRLLAQNLSPGATAAAADLAGQVYFVADEDSNSLMVMTAPKYFERLKAIIGELDRAVPQVLIKVLIAEVTHSDKRDLGVEFSALNLRPSGRGQQLFTDFNVAAATQGMIFRLVEADVTATLRALQEVGKLDVLSRPYILTSDNQAANIIVGQEVPFIRNTRTTETGQTINTIEYEDIGIILNVTPHINPDGLVILDVAPEISALTGDTVPISENVEAPVFAKRSAQSRVAIQNGQTIVIGGLMEDRKTDTIRKVPLLGDIPLLGYFFRRTIKETTKTELLIFLTPHVAKEPEALRGMTEQEEKATQVVPKAIKPGMFEEHMKGMGRGATSGEEAGDGTKP
jgi:general secretion pathway protein D